MTQNIILKSFQSPGDIVMLTAAIRDLHRAYPGRFTTDVRTSAEAIWEHSPYLTPLREGMRAWACSTCTIRPFIRATNARITSFTAMCNSWSSDSICHPRDEIRGGHPLVGG